MVILIMLLLFNYVIYGNDYAFWKQLLNRKKTLFETDLGAFQLYARLFWSQGCPKNYVVLMDIRKKTRTWASFLYWIQLRELIQLLPLFA